MTMTLGKLSKVGQGASVMLAALLAAQVASAETVTLWTFLDPSKSNPSPRDEALRQIIENFEAKHPDIKIKVEPQVWNQLGVKFQLAAETNTAPDVNFVTTADMGRLIQSGKAADLEALFVDDWSAEEERDFYIREGWNAGLMDGQRHTVPLFNASTVIFYRKDLLAEAGIDPATLDTWDAFTAAAVKLTKDTDGDGSVDVWGFGTPISTEKGGATTATVPMIAAAEGRAWDGETCTPNYLTDGGRKMVEAHVSWINEHEVMPKDILISNSDDLLEQFAAGRYAMAVAPFARYGKIQKQANWPKDELGVLTWPSWEEGENAPQQVQGWWAHLWADSPNLEAAADFLEHMISKESVRIWSVVGGQVPTRTSVFSQDEFDQPKYDYMRGLVKAWSEESFVNPMRCNSSNFDRDLNEAIQQVVAGNASVDEALKEAERQYLARQTDGS